MGYIKLNPKDAEKYGVDERVDFDLTAIGLRQRAAFEQGANGPGRSLRWLFDQLSGVPKLDEAGNPIPIPVLDDAGEPVFEDDGVTPKVTPQLTRDPEAVAMLIWLALWGVGVRSPWEMFDVRVDGLDFGFADEGDEDLGKGDEPTTDSASTPSD